MVESVLSFQKIPALSKLRFQPLNNSAVMVYIEFAEKDGMDGNFFFYAIDEKIGRRPESYTTFQIYI